MLEISGFFRSLLDVSMAIRLYRVMDGSGLGCSPPQFWHSMPWGRPATQSRERQRGISEPLGASVSTRARTIATERIADKTVQ
jgi:hypothetical protein